MTYIFLFFIWSVLINDFSDLSIILGISMVFITVKLTNLFFKNTIYGTIQLLIYSIGSILKMYKNTFQFIPLIFYKRHSGITHIDMKGKSDFEKAAISISVTLTPKTLALYEEDETLIIHKVSSNSEEIHEIESEWEEDIF
ncbi:Na+/H+ antiporter subunit E [Petrotoga sp. 9PWA.NaAc.5.4]|uniref:Na+/H+ antiporter subunit E n=1 Tax=Petrotoga sp. 9PWA.NaAc.5.4 TaxID=1434328 RepID=UPI000CCB181C|nr:Na+/H+ antiporter subunit E [Petrotoga sp. 9PWA.NaAc.5.4]PNR92543.1 hypothetical protein X924_09085 [Petrotoga sp. 9PWA.NaAc.5.4]